MTAQLGLGSTRRALHAFLARKVGSMPTPLLSTKMQLTTMLKSNGYFFGTDTERASSWENIRHKSLLGVIAK